MTRLLTPTIARRDAPPSAGYGHHVAHVIGPLDGRGRPLTSGPADARCDPSTGAGQCPRARIVTHRRPPPPAFGWDAAAEQRRADLAWWAERAAALAGPPGEPLDVDAAIGERGAWESNWGPTRE